MRGGGTGVICLLLEGLLDGRNMNNVLVSQDWGRGIRGG